MNRTIRYVFLFCLASFTQQNYVEIHLRRRVYQYNQIHDFFTQSRVDSNVGLFHFIAITNRSAMNMHVRVCADKALISFW